MARLIVPIVALGLGLAAAFALVSCGGDDAELLPGDTAEQIVDNLDTVEMLAAEGDCEGAQRAAAEVSGQVDALSGVDRELIQALRRGTDRLETVVAGCEETTTTETTETEATVPTESDEDKRTRSSKEDGREAEKKQEKVKKAKEKADGDGDRGEGPPPVTPPAVPPGQEEGDDDGAPAEPPSGGVEPNTPASGQ